MMLRGISIQQKTSTLLCRQYMRLIRRQYADVSNSETLKNPQQGGFGKWILLVFGSAIVLPGGVVAYAYYDPSFRDKLENSAPTLKPYLKKLYRERDDQKRSFDGADDLKKKISGALILPKRRDEKDHTDDSSTTKLKVTEGVATKHSKPSEVRNKDDEERNKLAIEESEKRKANHSLERRIQQILVGAEDATRDAIEAKQASVIAIIHHTKLLREAVENSDLDKKDPQWAGVADAYETMQISLKNESKHDKAAYAELEALRRCINEGRASKLTADNSLLNRTSEKLNNLTFDFEEAKAKVKEAQTEGKIMNEFKTLIEKGREQFSKELKSILPNVNIYEKGKKLSEDELNALIAHAHLRVDQLRQQFAEQQIREQQHIEQALSRQRADLEKESQQRIDREMAKIRAQNNIDVERKMNEFKKEWEDDLRAQLRRQAAAHSEHLQDVLRVKQEQFELESNMKAEEVRQEERRILWQTVANAMMRLQGIEQALEGRAEQDIENRRAKELWLACQNLLDAVIYGRKWGRDMDQRRKPLANDVMSVKEAGCNNAFVNTLVNSIPDVALIDGIYTEEDLAFRFAKVKRLCSRTAMVDEHGGSLLRYFVSFLQSLFIFDSSQEQFSVNEEIFVDKIDTFGVLARARKFIDDGDFLNAVRVMQLLRGEPARVAHDWIEDCRQHLETRQIAQLLLAHAAATSVRTVY